MPPVKDRRTRLVLLAIIALGWLLVVASVTVALSEPATRADMWWVGVLSGTGGGLVGVGIGMF